MQGGYSPTTLWEINVGRVIRANIEKCILEIGVKSNSTIKRASRASALRADIARGIAGLLVTYPIDPNP